MISRHSQSIPLLVTLALVTQAGCSFLAVTRPPRIVKGAPEPECTTSRIAPIADAIGAGDTGLLAALVPVIGHLGPGITGCNQASCTPSTGTVVAYSASLGAAALAYAASSIYGFVETSGCREAKGDYEREAHAALVAPALGTESHACRPAVLLGQAGTCDASLACVDNLCVAAR